MRDPFDLEFLAIRDEYSESELEVALIHRRAGLPELRTLATPAKITARHLMVGDIVILCSLVRPSRPRIGFLFVRSWLCSTLPSDSGSRQRPCASLILRHQQAG
jgi:hypothetical protein